MINGIEIMVNAAIRQISQLNCVTHNIANVNTPGFKAERFHFLKASSEKGADEGRPAQGPATTVDYSRGIMQKTGNVLDLVIDGKGFLLFRQKPALPIREMEGLRSTGMESWLHRPEIISLVEVEKLQLRETTSG